MIKILFIFYRFLSILRVGYPDYLGMGVLWPWTGWGGLLPERNWKPFRRTFDMEDISHASGQSTDWRGGYPIAFGLSATVPWTLGPDSQQTENQQSNEPTDQHTNKPTKQQTNTTASNKSRNESPNQPKNHGKIKQNSAKIAPKSVLEAVLGASWGFLGALGTILAPRRPKS